MHLLGTVHIDAAENTLSKVDASAKTCPSHSLPVFLLFFFFLMMIYGVQQGERAPYNLEPPVDPVFSGFMSSLLIPLPALHLFCFLIIHQIKLCVVSVFCPHLV